MSTLTTPEPKTPAQQGASCCGLSTQLIDEDAANRLAPMFKALGDPIRLRLAAMIASASEVCVCDLTPEFDVSAPTISHHLKVLREAGLVDCERRGTWVFYPGRRPGRALAPPGPLPRLTAPAPTRSDPARPD